MLSSNSELKRYNSELKRYKCETFYYFLGF
jgi:hypothetical protein